MTDQLTDTEISRKYESIKAVCLNLLLVLAAVVAIGIMEWRGLI